MTRGEKNNIAVTLDCLMRIEVRVVRYEDNEHDHDHDEYDEEEEEDEEDDDDDEEENDGEEEDDEDQESRSGGEIAALPSRLEAPNKELAVVP